MAEEIKIEREESFGTIPSVEFLSEQLQEVELENSAAKVQISEFRQKEISGLLKPEPLLQEDKSRFVLFPIKQPDVRVFFHRRIKTLM